MIKDYKIFFQKLLLFTIPVIVLSFMLERAVNRIPNSYNFKRSVLESAKDSIEVLITGNSQSLHAIDPDRLTPNSYSLANVSQSIYYDKELTLKYADQLKNLKMVIIPVSYISLYYSLDESMENWRLYYYYNYWGINPEYPFSKLDIKQYSVTAMYTPIIVLGYAAKGFRVNLVNNITRKGFSPLDSTGHRQEISFASGKSKMAMHYDALYHPGGYERVTKHFTDLVEGLSKRNIKVILLSIPTYQTYTYYYKPEVVKRNNLIIKDICNKYGCSYYDYTFDKRFSIDDYADNIYLNFLGAEKFSEIVNNEVIKPNWNSVSVSKK